jgi:ribosomal-protein-alanine N-acetyltransferase
MRPAGLTIREADRGDIPALAALERACFGEDAFSPRQLRYLVARAKSLCLTARLAGQDAPGVATSFETSLETREDAAQLKPAGEALAGEIIVLRSARHGHGRIYSLAVAPACRGRGIASALLEAGMAHLRAWGARRVFLEARMDNEAALALYRKAGFLPRGERAGYYHDGAPARLLARAL